MLIPILNDTKTDPIVGQIFLILLLPIVGLFALLIPFIPLFILYTLIKDYVQKKHIQRVRSTAPKFTNRRETLRRDSYTQERKSENR